MERGEPAYVVVLEDPPASVDPDGRFLRALERNYSLEAVFEGIPVYGRRREAVRPCIRPRVVVPLRLAGCVPPAAQ